MSILDRLEQIDNRILITILIICIVYPILSPIGLPIKIGIPAQTFYDYVDSVPDGSTVLYCLDTGLNSDPELGPSAVAIAKHFISKNCKIVWVSFGGGDAVGWYPILQERIQDTREYGVGYCYLGFVPGIEIAMASFARDVRGTTPTDFYGTDINQLSIMSGINDLDDFALVFHIMCMTDWLEAAVRQFAVPYDTPLITSTCGVCGPAAQPYYPATIKALLVGGTQGAEYELISGFPGKGLLALDAQSTAHLVIIAFVILGNISYLLKRFSSEPSSQSRGGDN
jgi:hypothetical protein